MQISESCVHTEHIFGDRALHGGAYIKSFTASFLGVLQDAIYVYSILYLTQIQFCAVRKE